MVYYFADPDLGFEMFLIKRGSRKVAVDFGIGDWGRVTNGGGGGIKISKYWIIGWGVEKN